MYMLGFAALELLYIHKYKYINTAIDGTTIDSIVKNKWSKFQMIFNGSSLDLYIDGKEMLYSHQNIIGAINSFLPYLTNDDLDELMLRFHTLKEHRRQKEYLSKLETLKHSWPYPDTIQQLEND